MIAGVKFLLTTVGSVSTMGGRPTLPFGEDQGSSLPMKGRGWAR
jgi:hypothetical protein